MYLEPIDGTTKRVTFSVSISFGSNVFGTLHLHIAERLEKALQVSISFGDLMYLEPKTHYAELIDLLVSISFGDLMYLELALRFAMCHGIPQL